MNDVQTAATLIDALDALEAKGYTEQFRAERHGLRATDSRTLFAPAELEIRETIRIEDTSDPNSQVVIFALGEKRGPLKGTYTVPHGPTIHPLDVEALQLLE